jgi:hypothetical protein
MEIQINEKFSLISQQTGGYDLIEKTVGKSGKAEGKEINKVIAYNTDIDFAINKVIHLNFCSKDQVITLKEFLTEFRKEKKELEDLLK